MDGDKGYIQAGAGIVADSIPRKNSKNAATKPMPESAPSNAHVVHRRRVMGFHKFLMKHGIGSPGYIARRMARDYRALSESSSSLDEHKILRSILVRRIASQTTFGGPKEYKIAKMRPEIIDAVTDHSSDLLSVVRYAVLVEHPELKNTHAPSSSLDLLDEVLKEILDSDALDWLKHRPVEKDLRRRKIDDPGVRWRLKNAQSAPEIDWSNASPCPMVWAAWSNGSSGYGFKVKSEDRDEYFKEEWKTIRIALPIQDFLQVFSVNIDKPSFWEGECRELISSNIGSWMVKNGYAPWAPGKPPKFSVYIAAEGCFRVEPIES
ncbi:MAG TPA: hypothetical protein VIJ79_09555 [Acidobacteriaceae bacterium]